MADEVLGPEPIEALRALARYCIENGYDSFVWTLRKGPHDPDGGVTDWRILIEPALPRGGDREI